MILTIIIGIICLAIGACVMLFIQKRLLKTKTEAILQEAEAEAEVIKKNKLLEVKEKFLNKKADLEKEVQQRNQKIQQAENKLK